MKRRAFIIATASMISAHVKSEVNSDQAPIQQKIDQAHHRWLAGAVNTEVYVPNGQYLVRALRMRSGVHLHLADNAKLIHPMSGTFDSIIEAYGSVSKKKSILTSDASKFDDGIDVLDGSLFLRGDLVRVIDDMVIGGFYQRQEIRTVRSVRGNRLWLTSPLKHPFKTMENANVTKLNPITEWSVNGGKLIVPVGRDGGGIDIDIASNFKLENIFVEGMNDNPGVQVVRSTEGRIDGAKFVDGQNLHKGGYGYGLSISYSTLCNVSGIDQRSVRESVVGSFSSDCIIRGIESRDVYANHFNTHGQWCVGITISDFDGRDSFDAGFACGYTTHHYGDEDVIFQNGYVERFRNQGLTSNNPVGLEARNVTFQNIKVARQSEMGGLVAGGGGAIMLKHVQDCVMQSIHVDCTGSPVQMVGGVYVLQSDNVVIQGCTAGYTPGPYAAGFATSNLTNSIVHSNSIIARGNGYPIMAFGNANSLLLTSNVSQGTAIRKHINVNSDPGIVAEFNRWG